jgi:uncharacterized protein (DUF302 family)
MALALLGLTGASSAKPAQLILESESRHGFADTIKRLRTAAKRSGWKLPNQLDMQASMKKFGHRVPPVTVLSLCKPDLAVKILGKDRHRHLSAMMPCRLSVFERSGKAYVARLNVVAVAKQLDAKAAAVMLAAGRGMERIIAAALR